MLLTGLATIALLAAGTVPVPAASQCVVVVRGADFRGVRLPAAVNALAYDAGQDLYYAVAGGRDLATITRDGVLTVKGPVPDGLKGAHAGTIANSTWLLTNGSEIVALDLATLAVTRRVALGDEPRIGDWDAWAGALYAVDTRGPDGPRLARIDPGSGRVRLSERLKALPGNGSYGGVVIDPAGTLHALHNPSGDLFHIPLSTPHDATVTHAGLRADSSDAAPCPRAPPQPPPPVPRPAPAQPPPPPPPSTTHSPIATVVPSSTPASKAARPGRRAHPVPTKAKVFFLGVIIPAIIVAARSAARRR